MDETKAAESRKRTGRITIGEITAHANWSASKDLVKITFETNLLSRDSLRKLNRYRASTKPLPVCFPVNIHGLGQKLNGVMLGFEGDTEGVTLYFKKAGTD
ncbi:MAG: hypothetical protein IAF94_14545 [Pirellulaceae bacterium]|nr:hypothetical protein [Pirellulaceae bacterium]